MIRNRQKTFIRLLIVVCVLVLSTKIVFESRYGMSQRSMCSNLLENPRRTTHDAGLNLISELNLFYCDVPKAASTNLRRWILSQIFLSEIGGNLTRDQIWIDHQYIFERFHFNRSSSTLKQDLNENIFKFVIVRHPFRRILSTFNDKFVNNHEEDTIFGWKQLEEQIILEMNTNESQVSIRRKDLRLDFRTFLLYIIQSIRDGREINSHWQMIVERCLMCSIDYDWIGRLEYFDKESKVLFQRLNRLPNRNSIEFPSKDLDPNKYKRPAYNDRQLFKYFRRTINNDQLFKILLDYYRPDLTLFNYSSPYPFG